MPTTMRLFRLTTLAAALALAGCATGLSNTTRVTPGAGATAMPALAAGAGASVKPGLAIERWWATFNDAALDRLMDEALAHNEDVEAAVARVREAQASLDAARGALLPSAELQVDSERAQRSTVGATPLPPGIDRRSNSHGVALAASYEVDLWGKLSSTSAAARHQLLASAWARAAVEWSLTARLAQAYFDLAALDRQIVISEAVRASRETTLAMRRRELDAGAGNEFDLRRAEAELTAAHATLASLARSRHGTEHALLLLLGRTPQALASASLARSALDESREYGAVLPQGAAADLLVRRPDVRQAEQELAAANASIDAARAATLPALRLTGVLGSDAKSIANLFSGPAFIWSIAASATQSIFDGGRLKAQVDQEHARAEQALAGYRKVIATAVIDVREAYAALDTTQQAWRAEQARAAALARARELAQTGYAHGALSYLDFLDAERNWYQAQLNQVSAHRDRLVAQVAAFKALGGGYAAAPAATAMAD